MKKILLISLCFILIFNLFGCSYNPPQGWTQEHYTYEEALAFVKSINPNATVSEKHTDTTVEFNLEIREWDAVINGVACHVASVGDAVWNDGFLAGEFFEVYYHMDTDYDYTVFKNITVKSDYNWEFNGSVKRKYDDTICAHLSLSEYRMLTEAELEQLWQTIIEINDEYGKYALKRKSEFGVPAPAKIWNQAADEYYVKKDSYTYIIDFTDAGKQEFTKRYYDRWVLLESGLPIRD